MNIDQLKPIVEAALLAAGEPLNFERLRELLTDESNERPATTLLKDALTAIAEDCQTRGVELAELASGYCFQVKAELSPWIRRLWQERAPRYSRALLETLAVIAYRQPITRGEIEDLRGVTVSSNIVKTLTDREWIRIVGQRDVPGKPSLYATTRQFLDHFNLRSLEELPALSEISDLDNMAKQLEEQLPAEEVAELQEDATAIIEVTEIAEEESVAEEVAEVHSEDN